MTKNHALYIISGLLFTLMPVDLQNYLAILMIVTVGILHGANDLSVVKHLFNKIGQNINRNMGMYIGIVLLGGLLFYALPSLALLVFIVVSAYHFGEQHFESKMSPSFSFLYYVSYGGLIFSIIFCAHISLTQSIIENITSLYIPSDAFWWGLSSCGLLWLIWMFRALPIQDALQELLLVVCLALLSFRSTLLFSFGFYFCFFHSLPSLRSQLIFLFGSASMTSLKSYIYQSFLYWLMALVGLVAVLSFVAWDLTEILPLFFVFLAAITFPHVVVMGFLFHRIGSKHSQ